MLEDGRRTKLGYFLNWHTHGRRTYYNWIGMPVCTVDERNGKYILTPGVVINTTGITMTEYDSPEEAHDYILRLFKIHKESFDALGKKRKKQLEQLCKKRQIEESKYYDLESITLTPEHNLLYADGLSTRSLNTLKQVGISTLRELSYWKRSDFARLRNCGKNTVEEMDTLLLRVGLTWGMKQRFDSVTLSALIEKLQAQLKEHPEYANRMVYSSDLHLDGVLMEIGDNTIALL